MYKMYKTYAYYIITKAVADGVRSNTAPIYICAPIRCMLPPPSGGVGYIYRRSKNREKDLFVDLTRLRTLYINIYIYIVLCI